MAKTTVGVVPGVILLAVFIPQHIRNWDKFPVWYHLTFLVSLVPLTCADGTLAEGRGLVPSNASDG